MATTTQAVAVDSNSGALSHKQIMTILSGLILGMFLAALDQMIVSTAIRTIGDDLHGLSAQAWVTTAFLITSTISTPLLGKLSDIYGRKKLFMFSITVFILGSALCGLAHSMYQLAAFRAFQGIGAGGLMPLALAIIGDIIPPRERARYQGYFMAVFATASVLGPVIGGFFAGQAAILGISGWRWIFYINVPIGILALVVVEAVLKLEHIRREHRIDWGGAGMLVLGLVPLLLIAEQGRTWGWDSTGALVCYVLGAIGLAAFIWVESKMGDDALLPLRLFRGSVFSVGSGQSFIIGMGMFGGLVSIPLYLQIVKGASPTEAGLLILPMVAGIMAASLVAGQVTSRTGRYKIFPVVGSILLVVGLLLMSTVGADTSLWPHRPVHAHLRLRPRSEHAEHRAGHAELGERARHGRGHVGSDLLPPGRRFARDGDLPVDPVHQRHHQHQRQPQQVCGIHTPPINLNDTAPVAHLPEKIKQPILVGFSDAMDLVFLVGACVLVIAVVLSFMLKEVPLRTMSGLQAARAEAAENDATMAAASAASHDAEQSVRLRAHQRRPSRRSN